MFDKDIQEIENEYARVSVKTARDFGCGRLKIAASTFDFLVAVTPYVDISGKICEELNTIRLNLKMTISKFQYALNQALAHNLLHKDGNEYYSKFHDYIGPNVVGLQYIPIINMMMDEKFLKLNLRDKRFFYYLLTSGQPGRIHRVALYNLYRNKKRREEVGIGYFQTQQELLESIDRLMSAGLITVSAKIRKQEVKLQGYSDKAELRMLLGFKESENASNKHRKRRITSLTDDDVLFFQVNNSILKEKIINKASKTELAKKFEYRGVYFDVLKESHKRFFVSAKNKLYSMMGVTGVNIYHDTLDKFLEDHYNSVPYYDDKDKLFSTYRDYYLIPHITEMLTEIVTSSLKNNHSEFIENTARPIPTMIQSKLTKYLQLNEKHISKVESLRYAAKLIEVDKENRIIHKLYDNKSFEYQLYDRAMKYIRVTGSMLEDVKPEEFQHFILQMVQEGQLRNDLQLESLVKAIQFTTEPTPAQEELVGILQADNSVREFGHIPGLFESLINSQSE